jgi:7-keto-8-aminopelargonate synthetase-like enzyme
MAPPVAAAALAAVEILEEEPERVRRLNDRAALFLRLARDGGLDVGGSVGAAIVPIVTGSSITAARLSQALFDRGVNVQPILYPAVPERSDRPRGRGAASRKPYAGIALRARLTQLQEGHLQDRHLQGWHRRGSRPLPR